MGYREDLDLSDVIDKFEAFGGVPSDQPQPWDMGWEPVLAAGEGDFPAVAGFGPLRASTSRVLASTRPAFAWDPNRYYRDLGIGWPYVHATRRDLRLAYQRLEGQNSERLTYCFKQLLNHREEYDALGLGQQYLDDIYVQEALRQWAVREADRRGVSPETFLRRAGFSLIPEEDSTPGILDNPQNPELDEPAQHSRADQGWNYAFCLWRTTSIDRERLASWQALLIAEIGERVPSLVVGLMGKNPAEYAIGEMARETVVFLNRDAEPTADLASRAVTALIETTSRASRDTTREQV